MTTVARTATSRGTATRQLTFGEFIEDPITPHIHDLFADSDLTSHESAGTTDLGTARIHNHRILPDGVLSIAFPGSRFEHDHDLPDPLPVVSDIDARFLAFHQKNPVVYEELRRLARQATNRGATRIGIKMLWEVLRWRILLDEVHFAGESFKLSNDFHSRYARLLMDENEDLAGVFELRELRS